MSILSASKHYFFFMVCINYCFKGINVLFSKLRLPHCPAVIFLTNKPTWSHFKHTFPFPKSTLLLFFIIFLCCVTWGDTLSLFVCIVGFFFLFPGTLPTFYLLLISSVPVVFKYQLFWCNPKSYNNFNLNSIAPILHCQSTIFT